MSTFLRGFFLPLCLLLLSGYGQRYGFAYQAGTHFSDIRILDRSARDADAGLNRQALIIKSPSTKKGKFRLEIAPFEEDEVKEHELISSKKHTGTSHFATPNSYFQSIGYFFGCTKKSLPFCKHFSNITSYKRYLAFQVLRI